MNYTVNGINAISRNSNGNWYLAGAPVTSILYGNGNSIIIGPNAGANIIGSSSSLITGIGAGYGDTTLPDYIASNHDTFYGNQAGYNIGNSGGNVLYGYRSGYNINSSGGNILIGGNSGYNIQDSFGNIVLGNGVGIKADTNSHLNIGNLLYGTGIYNGYQLETDTYALSSTPSGGFIGIGTDSPTGTLSVKGTAGSLPFVLSSSTNQVMFEVAQSGDECHWNTVTSKWWVYQYSTSSPTLVPVASSTCF